MAMRTDFTTPYRKGHLGWFVDFYIDNDVTPEERMLIEIHLATCKECRKEVAGKRKPVQKR